MCFYCAFYETLTLRIIVCDAGVGPFSAENTAECLAALHRYFGLRAKETRTEAEERERGIGREARVQSAVILLVKASLFCEFLISVHLLVIPSRLHETSCTQNIHTPTHMVDIHVYTPDDGGKRKQEETIGREGKRERRSKRGLFSSEGKPSPSKANVQRKCTAENGIQRSEGIVN